MSRTYLERAGKRLAGSAAVLLGALLAAAPVSAEGAPAKVPTGLARVVNGYGEWTDPRFYQAWMYDEAYLRSLAADPDPKIQANKFLVVSFEAELGRAVFERRVERDIEKIVNQFATVDYNQMDPNIPEGRDGLVKWFKAGGMHAGPSAPTAPPPPVALIGDGDSVAMMLQLPPEPYPDNPKKFYSSYLLSVFRVRDGRISAHYDSAKRGAEWCRIDCGKSPQ